MTAQSAGLVERLHATTLSDDDIAVIEAALAAPAANGVLSDAQCDAIYFALDAWARDLDTYDFGLPMVVGDGVDGGRKVIRDALAAAPQAQGASDGR